MEFKRAVHEGLEALAHLGEVFSKYTVYYAVRGPNSIQALVSSLFIRIYEITMANGIVLKALLP